MTDSILDTAVQFGLDGKILQQRSRHDVLVPVEVRVGINLKTIQTALRVASDAHLRLTLQREGLERSFDAVKKVMQAVAGGMLSKSSDYSGIIGRECGVDGRDAMLTHWIAWAAEVKKSGLDMGIVQDIILMGKSVREIDRDRRMRKGRSMIVLIDALKLW